MKTKADRDRFYEIIDSLMNRVGYRCLCDCNGRMGWPPQGVYFFFEPGEWRPDGSTRRIVRVGTHAVSKGSRRTLWNRLSSHRGIVKSGGGNHRGSIFRLHVGGALLKSNGNLTPKPETWGCGSNALKISRGREQAVEIAVSQYIGAMPFIWVRAEDEASANSIRAIIETNSIQLLSRIAEDGESADLPSTKWLGSYARHETVRASGLWNVKATKGKYDAEFLDLFDEWGKKTPPLGEWTIRTTRMCHCAGQLHQAKA